MFVITHNDGKIVEVFSSYVAFGERLAELENRPQALAKIGPQPEISADEALADFLSWFRDVHGVSLTAASGQM